MPRHSERTPGRVVLQPARTSLDGRRRSRRTARRKTAGLARSVSCTERTRTVTARAAAGQLSHYPRERAQRAVCVVQSSLKKCLRLFHGCDRATNGRRDAHRCCNRHAALSSYRALRHGCGSGQCARSLLDCSCCRIRRCLIQIHDSVLTAPYHKSVQVLATCWGKPRYA